MHCYLLFIGCRRRLSFGAACRCLPAVVVVCLLYVVCCLLLSVAVVRSLPLSLLVACCRCRCVLLFDCCVVFVDLCCGRLLVFVSVVI